jgi:hypothetical protein
MVCVWLPTQFNNVLIKDRRRAESATCPLLAPPRPARPPAPPLIFYYAKFNRAISNHQRSILEQMARIEAAIPCLIPPPPLVMPAAEAGPATASMSLSISISMCSAELSILGSSEAVAEGGGESTEGASENGVSPPGGLRMSRVGKS